MSSLTDRPYRPRRFYTSVSLIAERGEFAVALDGRAAKTPAGARLAAPSERLAALLAEEWAAQGDQIDFSAMPASRLAFTAIDRTSGARSAVAGEIAKLIGADVLCYFAERPASLVDRQEQLWAPWLAWAERELGLVLLRAEGVNHQIQPAETLARTRALAEAADDFRLSALAFAGGLYGSAVLAFAVERGAITGEAAFDLSRFDEAFQEELWGVDSEAAARTDILRRDALMIDAWFAASRS